MTTPIHVIFSIVIGLTFMCCGPVAFADEIPEGYDDTPSMTDDASLMEDDSELYDEEMDSDDDAMLDGEGDEPIADDDLELYDEETDGDDDAMYDNEGDEPITDDDSEISDEDMEVDDQEDESELGDYGVDAAPARGRRSCDSMLDIDVNAQGEMKISPSRKIARNTIVTISNDSNRVLEIGFVPTKYFTSPGQFKIQPKTHKAIYVKKPKSVRSRKFNIRAILGPDWFMAEDDLIICK